MRDPLSPLRHPAATAPPPSTAAPTHRPSLWQALGPARQHSLARCLAELIRRLRDTPLTASAEEISDEPS
jgi:hypothetical protein